MPHIKTQPKSLSTLIRANHSGASGGRRLVESTRRLTRHRPGQQQPARSHPALLVSQARFDMCVAGEVDGREGDVSQETGFRALGGREGEREETQGDTCKL